MFDCGPSVDIYGLDVLADDVLRTLPPDTLASEIRAITLAIDFRVEFLHATAESLLAEVEAHFGHLDDVVSV